MFPKLIDWTQNEDKRIRYYSGTAIYRKNIQLNNINKKERVWLRFPKLCSMARVVINNQEVSTIWCSPWEADLTPFIREGNNKLEIYVTNSLMNRMIGDATLPQDSRYTYAYPEIVTSRDKLVSSGIIGDVFLVKYEEIE